MLLDIIGWVGGILLTFCGVPLAIQAYKEGHCRAYNWTFLNMWFWGEVGVLTIVLDPPIWPLILNYSFNILLILVLVYYKVRPRT